MVVPTCRPACRPLVLAFALGAAVSCEAVCDRAEGESAWYRATVEGELGPIPFYLRVPGPDEAGDAEIKNGSERLPVQHSWAGEWVNLEFPHWGTGIEAEKLDSGELEGVWRASPLFDEFEVPLTAEPVAEPDPERRFEAEDGAEDGAEEAEIDVDGTWEASFDQTGEATIRIEERAPGVVEGTIVQRQLSGGDFGSLAGNVRGDRLLLSTFDGQKGFRLEGNVSETGQMAGQWEFTRVWSESFRAQRASAEADSEPEGATRVSVDRVSGIEIPGLDDPRYEGRPVIVSLFGTWCTTCGDHAPVLRDLYERYRDDGLEIHAVAYEGVDDEAFIETQLETYRDRYGADWPIVPVTGPIDEAMPPELGHLDVLPITLFRDAEGEFKAVRAGFVSPASGEAHERQVEEFEALTRAIARAE